MPGGEAERWQIELTAAKTPPPSGEATIPDSHAGQEVVGGGLAGPARLGPYAIQRELGRGGQGVVYQASDTRLGRQVALKVLSNMFAADAWSRLRFEREATATARLDHPGICTVYEAGTIDQVPFIAMRLVGGESLAARIARSKAEPAKTSSSSTGSKSRQRREALFGDVEIVEKVARALHVAHEAGLVHRDIKPGNVMVEPSGQPVVLDFGLARDAQNTDLLLTGTGTFLGTPPYMSPEQVDATGSVDRRTDVWALGVVLYEIATGTRPFEAPTIEGLLRAIRTAEPPDPRRLNAAVTPELSAVILHALEKDKGHRYQDALALADDLGRARRLEPVRARAPSAMMRLWRWSQRNPVLAASLAIVVAGLSVALAISLASLGTVRDALGRETAALGEARQQRDRAEDLLAFMLGEMKMQLETVGRLDLLGKVARKATDYFATRPLDLDQETESLQRALALRNVGDVIRSEGDVMTAVARYEDAWRIEEEIWRRNPRNAAALKDLCGTALAFTSAAMIRGDRKECLARAERSLELRKTLVELTPDDADAHGLLASGFVMQANALKFADRTADSLPIYEEAIRRWESLCAADSRPVRRRELAVALQNFGEARRLTDDLAGAIEARTRGLAVFESLAQDDPQALDWQEQIAATHHGIALVLNERNDYRKAVEHSRQAVEVFRRLLAGDPINKRRLFQLATALSLLSNACTNAGHDADALEALKEAASARARLVGIDPKNRAWRSELGDSERAIGVLMGSMGRTEQALAQIDVSVNRFRELTEEAPADAFNHGKLADALSRSGFLLYELGRPVEALRRYLDGVEAAKAECSNPRVSARAIHGLSRRLDEAAETARILGDRATSSDLMTHSIDRERAAIAAFTEHQRDEHAVNLSSLLTKFAAWQIDDGSARSALPLLRESVSLLEGAREQLRKPTDADLPLCRAFVALADAQGAIDDFDGAEASANRAESALKGVPQDTRSESTALKVRARLDLVRRLRPALAPDGPRDPIDREALGRYYAATQRPAEAIPHFAAALAAPAASQAIRLESLEAAVVAVLRVLSGAPSEQHELLQSTALGWIAEQSRLQIERIRKLEFRATEQAEKGQVDNHVREELSDLRSRLAALKTYDTSLAPLRKLAEFERAAGAPK